MTRTFFSTVILASFMASHATAAPYQPSACDTGNASANGSLAVECKDNNSSGYPANNGDGTITDFMASIWTDAGSLTTVTKNGTSSDGFSFAVSDAEEGAGFTNYFEFLLPEEYLGTQVDWVLAVKQSQYLVSYRFDDLLVEQDQPAITGYFNSPWKNGNDDFSWVGGLVGETTIPVPEPGSLALLGLGLIGLRFARRCARSA